MISGDVMRKGAGFLSVCLVAAVFSCGGGGGGSSSNNSGGSTGSNTQTRTSNPQGFTPTPPPDSTPIPSPVVVPPGGDIGQTAKRLPPGSTIFLSAGQYPAFTLSGLTDITLIADVAAVVNPAGQQGPVVVNGAALTPAIQISDSSGITLNGLTITGGLGSGISIANSPGTIVRNCIVDGNHIAATDGVLVSASVNVLIFNNLIFKNSGNGIHVIGGGNVQLINNTVSENQLIGLQIGDNGAPTDAFVRNNIVDSNKHGGIAAAFGSVLDADYNLYNANVHTYLGTAVKGANDLSGDPQFTFVGPSDVQGFYLTQISPAVDAGDPSTDTNIVELLTSCGGDGCLDELDLTTQVDNSLDVEPVDIGYHHSIVLPLPTPTRVPVTRPPRTATPTRTPTRAPT